MIKELEKEVLDSILTPPGTLTPGCSPVRTAEAAAVIHLRPTAASLGLKESIDECLKDTGQDKGLSRASFA